MNRIRKFLAVALLPGLALPACRSPRGPASPYQDLYDEGLEGLTVPSAEEIRSLGISRQLAAGAVEAWRACIRMAAQTWGILGVESDSGGVRRMVFVWGKAGKLKAPQLSKSRAKIASQAMDRWFAISLTPESTGSCVLHGAWISPETGRIGIASDDVEGDDGKSVAWGTLNTFLNAVETQVEGEDIWMAKITTRPKSEGNPVRRREVVGAAKEIVIDDLARRLGNYLSAELRTSYLVLEHRRVEQHIRSILERLFAASGNRVDNVPVLVLFDKDNRNARVTPNGEFFLFSGMLDSIENEDELACLLAHELDHLIQGDSMERQKKILSSEQMESTVAVLLIAAATVAVVSLGTPDSAAPADTLLSLGEAVGLGALSAGLLVGGAWFGSAAGRTVGEILTGGFTKEQEIRADANGVRYARDAGYNAKSWLVYLKRRLNTASQLEGAPNSGQ